MDRQYHSVFANNTFNQPVLVDEVAQEEYGRNLLKESFPEIDDFSDDSDEDLKYPLDPGIQLKASHFISRSQDWFC